VADTGVPTQPLAGPPPPPPPRTPPPMGNPMPLIYGLPCRADSQDPLLRNHPRDQEWCGGETPRVLGVLEGELICGDSDGARCWGARARGPVGQRRFIYRLSPCVPCGFMRPHAPGFSARPPGRLAMQSAPMRPMRLHAAPCTGVFPSAPWPAGHALRSCAHRPAVVQTA
jgi:hypothetical protein